jgi:hypothetical protein
MCTQWFELQPIIEGYECAGDGALFIRPGASDTLEQLGYVSNSLCSCSSGLPVDEVLGEACTSEACCSMWKPRSRAGLRMDSG